MRIPLNLNLNGKLAEFSFQSFTTAGPMSLVRREPTGSLVPRYVLSGLLHGSYSCATAFLPVSFCSSAHLCLFVCVVSHICLPRAVMVGQLAWTQAADSIQYGGILSLKSPSRSHSDTHGKSLGRLCVIAARFICDFHFPAIPSYVWWAGRSGQSLRSLFRHRTRHGPFIVGEVCSCFFDLERFAHSQTKSLWQLRVVQLSCSRHYRLLPHGKFMDVARGTGALTTFCRTQLDLELKFSSLSRRAVNNGGAAVSVHK